MFIPLVKNTTNDHPGWGLVEECLWECGFIFLQTKLKAFMLIIRPFPVTYPVSFITTLLSCTLDKLEPYWNTWNSLTLSYSVASRCMQWKTFYGFMLPRALILHLPPHFDLIHCFPCVLASGSPSLTASRIFPFAPHCIQQEHSTFYMFTCWSPQPNCKILEAASPTWPRGAVFGKGVIP